MKNLRDIDLNLLVIFDRLFAERSVTKVAATLSLGQPAVSNALSRLRKMFDDELFIRTPTGMSPTPFAAQLESTVAEALRLIQGVVDSRASFEPLTSERGFSIGMTDIGEIYFLPELMEELQTKAPSVSISTVRNAAVNLKEAMQTGQVDMAIGLIPHLESHEFFQRRLFLQKYVCMFRKGHPLDKPKMKLSEFFAANHVAIVSAGTGHGRVDELIDSGASRRRIKLRVPHFVAVGHILQSTDMIATVPERLAEKMIEPFGLGFCPHPVKLPAIEINLFWHAKLQKDPANQWLRSLIGQMFSDASTSKKLRPAQRGAKHTRPIDVLSASIGPNIAIYTSRV